MGRFTPNDTTTNRKGGHRTEDRRRLRRRDSLSPPPPSSRRFTNRNQHFPRTDAERFSSSSSYSSSLLKNDNSNETLPDDGGNTTTTTGRNISATMTTMNEDTAMDEKQVKFLLGELDPELEREKEEAREMEERRKRRREIVETMGGGNIITTTTRKEDYNENSNEAKKSKRDGMMDAGGAKTIPEKKKEKDMFDSDSEDMFGESDEEENITTTTTTAAANTGNTKTTTTTMHKAAAAAGGNDNNSQALKDNWDDIDGYYRAKLGEQLDDGRYEVMETNFGKGVFSSVLKAKDLSMESQNGESSAFVAIKIIRNNETMRKASKTEIAILKKLSDRDPERKKHVVQFHRSFEFRGHVFLVFEKLSMNLREAAKKFGRDVGISISAVRVYARQLFVALMHLQKCGIVHADIKPDNVLVNDQLNVLKICDFGSALFNADNELTPYLASRFYRAPEVVLGLPYSFPIDLWAVGCCLYELYVGKICFPGKSNNEMLKYFVEMKGAVPKKVLRKAAFKEKHFDRDENLRIAEVDKVTGKTMFRVFDNNTLSANKTGHLESMLNAVCVEHGGDDFERKKVRQLSDLLEKIFILDPERRITAGECLQHPFIIDTSK